MIRRAELPSIGRVRLHILQAGPADARRVIGSSARDGKLLFKGCLWNDSPDETLRGVLQNPGWLAGFGIANNHTTVGIFSLTCYTRKFQRETIGERHVTV